MTDAFTDHHQTHPDSARRRVRDSQRPLSVARRHFAPYPRLYAYRFDLPPGPLYGLEAHREARALVGQTFPSGPARWKLEGMPGERRHVHVISPLPPRAVPDAGHAQPVYDLPGLLAYLAKPADPRLCAPGPLRAYSPDAATRRANRDAAHLDYGDARRAALASGRRRLSPLSGWVNTRPASPRLVPVVLVLAVLRFLLAGSLMDPQNRAPLPGVHPAPHRPLPGRPVRPWCYSLPPPRTQAQARQA